MEDSPATAADASTGSTPACGRDAETGDDVGVLRLVVGLPIAHLAVFQDACPVAVLAANGACHRIHVVLADRPSQAVLFVGVWWGPAATSRRAVAAIASAVMPKCR